MSGTVKRLRVAVSAVFALTALGATGFLFLQNRQTPGIQEGGSILVTTNQALTPFGIVQRIEGARCKDLALSPKGDLVAVLCNGRVAIFSVRGEPVAEVKLRTAALGLAWQPDGTGFWVSGDNGQVTLIRKEGNAWKAGPEIKADLPADQQTPKGGNPQVLGLALSPDAQTLYAALGRRNAVAAISLAALKQPEGKAAFDRAYVVQISPYHLATDSAGLFATANRGGAAPARDEPVADSAGTAVAIDPATDAANRGSVTLFGAGLTEPISIATGRQPSGIAFSPDRKTLAVADSDSDTVTLIDVATKTKQDTIGLRPSIEPRYGHEPTDVTWSDDGTTLFVTCGGINAVAVLARSRDSLRFSLFGHIPTAWYPIALEQRRGNLIVACAKGIGNRLKDKTTRFGVHDNVGVVQFIKLRDALKQLPELSVQVAKNNRWGEELPARADQPERPIPQRVGEPSVFKHVVYIIKENHTYDTDFGDIKEGNGDPSLCLFGEQITPNAHALARQFVLLDNVYTSGTNSADGHQWTSTAIANAYTEQNYSANVRSYPYDGGDPLAFSPNGFLWTAATASKVGVRVYGEFVDKPVVKDPATGKSPNWKQLWDDYKAGTNKFDIHAETSQAALRDVMHPKFIGFPSIVSDQWRADQFLAEFKFWDSQSEIRNPKSEIPQPPDPSTPSAFPALCILLLPNNHTNGSAAGMPRPRSQVADNDLALGRIVDAISHSKFWKETLILVIEDDSQLGLDHVDGHRTVAQAISPYTRRGSVVSQMYNHTSFIRTMGLVLGIPALTRFDRTATPLAACFTGVPDFTPFTFIPNKVPLDDLNPPASALTGEARRLAEACAKLNWQDVDLADAETVARAVWHAQRPKDRFPTEAFHPNRDGDD